MRLVLLIILGYPNPPRPSGSPTPCSHIASSSPLAPSSVAVICLELTGLNAV